MIVYEWILQHIDIISMVIDFLSFIVTFVLTLVIYKLERKHEKEHDKAKMRAEEKAVEEAAKVFLIDNEEELEYLLLSEIAARLKLKSKHCRQITTRYLRCNEQLQREILKQANIDSIEVSIKNVRKSLELLQSDMNEHGFGKNIFYDDSKYFYRAFERWADISIEDANPYIFKNLKMKEKNGWYLWNADTSLFSYMWDYDHCDEFDMRKEKIQPPVDMVFQQCNLGTCKESDMTFWTMRIIIDSCYIFKQDELDVIFDEQLLQTQEDMYYYTLAVLCSAYDVRGEHDEEA